MTLTALRPLKAMSLPGGEELQEQNAGGIRRLSAKSLTSRYVVGVAVVVRVVVVYDMAEGSGEVAGEEEQWQHTWRSEVG